VERMLSSHPNLLCGYSEDVLSHKLDFLRRVVGLDNAAIRAPYLTYSVADRLRPRYFYALQRGALQHYAYSTLVACSEAKFVKMAHGLARGTQATLEDLTACREHTESPAFRAYMDEQEVRATRKRND